MTKKPTDLLGTPAMIRRVTQYPITKDEILNYLLKIQKTNTKLDPALFKNRICGKEFGEIIKEVNEVRKKKKRCQQIINMCNDAQTEFNESIINVDKEIN